MQGSQPSLDAPVHGLETTQRRSSWYGHSKSRTETQSQAEASNCRSLQDNHQARQPRSTPVRSSSCSSSRSSSRSSSQSQIPRTNSIDQCGNADCLTTQGRSRRPYPADRTRHSRLFHSTSQLRTSFRSSSTNRGPFLDSVMGLATIATVVFCTCICTFLRSSHLERPNYHDLLMVPPAWVDFSWELGREKTAIRT